MAKPNTNNSEEVVPCSKVAAHDLRLNIHLSLSDSTGEVAVINQEVDLPGLLYPSFLPDAYNQVDRTLQVLGVDYFQKLVKNYLFKKLDNTFTGESKALFSDTKTLIASEEQLESAISENGPGGIDSNPDTGPSPVIDLPVEK